MKWDIIDYGHRHYTFKDKGIYQNIIYTINFYFIRPEIINIQSEIDQTCIWEEYRWEGFE